MAERIVTDSGVTLTIDKRATDTFTEIAIALMEYRRCILHWGLRHGPKEPWQVPPRASWPRGSRPFDQGALRTPFPEENGHRILIRLDRALDFPLLDFVLFFPEEDRWENNHGRNFKIELQGHEPPPGAVKDILKDLAVEIIDREVSRNSWTLMHRYNLCHDLLDRVEKGNVEALALMFVWLRFSAIRQLDWQRNYNTKPRELGHAMDRLTRKLAARYAGHPGERGILRLIMGTLGKGSDAQRVRDEVLNIMHRHHIKEVSGHFMEEWHQKLHNNTTPDDIAICEAYLEYQRSGGDLDRFYGRLEEDGVSKERLESYERPIRSHPDFIPHLRDALIRDFEHFLGILKEVHSGTDLGIAIKGARHLFDEEMHRRMDFLWQHHGDPGMPTTALAEKVTEARRVLRKEMEDEGRVRDILFLDIALEVFLRTAIERQLDSAMEGDALVDLIALVLENLCLSHEDGDFRPCLGYWERLRGLQRFERTWSLQAKAASEGTLLALNALADRRHRLLQPMAEYMGGAFGAKPWTVTLFSEEVLRGQLTFVLSMLLHFLDPVLRRSAELGDWQLISRHGNKVGKVEVVPSLTAIQGRAFEAQAVILTDDIKGDEEIPGGVEAIVTPSSIDSLSHLAIRARNAGILFAVCFDDDVFEDLKSYEGMRVRLTITPRGDVEFRETHEEGEALRPGVPISIEAVRHPFTSYTLPLGDFTGESVGYKSVNLKRLREKLPGWISMPKSLALTFGVIERILGEALNREAADKYRSLTDTVDSKGAGEAGPVLRDIRDTVLALWPSKELVSALKAGMEDAGLPFPSEWDAAWTCIKRVWASKWNDRAYLSRRANGIRHEDLMMSVLIQEAIASEYSYVIHTVNPFTAGRDELYAEVVLGLGETLAGNYPGRALGFASNKDTGEIRLLSFPSKGVGLFGGGLIFRSDSNGEDLEGYAGAGLYDSFVLPPPRRVPLDYTNEKLVWDPGFRQELLFNIARLGQAVEGAMGAPQDIEGAFSGNRFHLVQTRPQVGMEVD